MINYFWNFIHYFIVVCKIEIIFRDFDHNNYCLIVVFFDHYNNKNSIIFSLCFSDFWKFVN